MQRIETNSENPENPENLNQTVIELKPLVNGANHNPVQFDNTVINTH